MQERRTAERVRTNLKARWEGLISQGRGTICDLGSGGCFVLTGGEVTAGELVRLEIHLTDRVDLVWGEVVYAIEEMGFALRFDFGSDDQKEELESLVDSAQL